jgi:predicted Zn-dependent peptidase
MKYVLLLIFAFSLSIAGLAQSASTAKNITEFDVNGLKVIVKRRPSSPTVSAGLFVRGGVRNQTVEKAGLESLALSVATEASTKFPRVALRKELSRTGSTLSAGSAYDFSVLSLSSTRPHFDRTWDIFTDVVLNPAFAKTDFDLVRDRTLTALRNRGVSPDDALNGFEERVLFTGHPYAADPSGTLETVQAITLADAKAYYKKLIESSRLLLIVVGDVDPAAFQKRVTASFGKLQKGNYSEPELAKIAFTEPTVDVSQRSLPTNYVKGVFAAPALGDPDYHAMHVAMTILQSRVYNEVRTKRNLSYAPNAEMDNNAANTANIYVTATDANQAVSVMLNEINSMKRETMEADQLDGISGYFLTTYYLQQEANAAQVAELARYELIGGGWAKSLGFLDGVQKVTPDQIRSVANKYMKNIRFFVVGNPSAINKPTFLGN